MLNVKNIHSLTDFKKATPKFLELLQAAKSPLILTVKGRAAYVIQDADVFNETQQEIDELKREVAHWKSEAFTAAVSHGVDQLDRGIFSPLTGEEIIAEARASALARA